MSVWARPPRDVPVVHIGGPDDVALCRGRTGQLVSHAEAFSSSERYYSCPACRAALGGTECMKGSPAPRPARHVRELAGVATGGAWLWDASSYDHARGPVDVALAAAQGIAGVTHKATEGTGYVDPYWASTYQRMRASRLACYGPYHVLWPSSQVSITAQVAFLVGVLDSTAPGWRTDPRLVVQLDAERFSYMPSAPTVVDCNQFRAQFIAARGRGDVAGYLPRWLYGVAGGGYTGPLWSSAYVSGAGSPAAIYPGDNGVGWVPYGPGQRPPLIWQFSASATVAGQTPCDINAARGGIGPLLAVLAGTFTPSAVQGDDDMITYLQERKVAGDEHNAHGVWPAVWEAQGGFVRWLTADQLAGGRWWATTQWHNAYAGGATQVIEPGSLGAFGSLRPGTLVPPPDQWSGTGLPGVTVASVPVTNTPAAAAQPTGDTAPAAGTDAP